MIVPFPSRRDEEESLAAKKKPDFYGPNLNVHLICPNCRDEVPNIIEQHSAGDLICGDCGLVLGDREVNTQSEWRTFSSDEGPDPSRVGAATNILLGDGVDFSTSVGEGKDTTGLGKDLARTAMRVNSYRTSGSPSANGGGSSGTGTNRNLSNAYQEIDIMCDHISLPKTVVDVAKQLFKRVDDKRVLRGKPAKAVIAACIFIACRVSGPGVERSFTEIYLLTGVSKKVIGQCYQTLRREFTTGDHHFRTHIQAPTPPSDSAASSVQTPGDEITGAASGAEELMGRFCNQLGLPVSFHMKAIDVARAIAKHGLLDGRSPMTVAGTAMYFSSHLFGQGKSAKDIASVALISEGTIRARYKFLLQHKEKLVNPSWLKSGAAKMERLPSS